MLLVSFTNTRVAKSINILHGSSETVLICSFSFLFFSDFCRVDVDCFHSNGLSTVVWTFSLQQGQFHRH